MVNLDEGLHNDPFGAGIRFWWVACSLYQEIKAAQIQVISKRGPDNAKNIATTKLVVGREWERSPITEIFKRHFKRIKGCNSRSVSWGLPDTQ